MNEGVTETDVSVVDLDETAEKQLNIAMNKVTGEWDEVKLKELLDGLGDAAPETDSTCTKSRPSKTTWTLS